MKRYFLSSIVIACVASTVGIALADSPADCDDLSGRSLGVCNAFHASACANDAESLACNTLREVWTESGNEDPIPGDETVVTGTCWCDRDGDTYYELGYTPGEIEMYADCGVVPQTCGDSGEPVPDSCVISNTEMYGSGYDSCDLDPTLVWD